MIEMYWPLKFSRFNTDLKSLLKCAIVCNEQFSINNSLYDIQYDICIC